MDEAEVQIKEFRAFLKNGADKEAILLDAEESADWFREQAQELEAFIEELEEE